MTTTCNHIEKAETTLAAISNTLTAKSSARITMSEAYDMTEMVARARLALEKSSANTTHMHARCTETSRMISAARRAADGSWKVGALHTW